MSIRTEDEDVLQALEMRGLVLILLLFGQLLGHHASVTKASSQPGGGKPHSFLPQGRNGGKKLLPSPWRSVSTQNHPHSPELVLAPLQILPHHHQSRKALLNVARLLQLSQQLSVGKIEVHVLHPTPGKTANPKLSP